MKQFFDFFVRNWVLSLMISVSLLVLGLYSWTGLPLQQTPDVDFPMVNITTVYPGAGPEQVERLVSKELEDAVSTIDGIEQIRSTNRQGFSSITVQFELERDVDVALQDVKRNLDPILNELPERAEQPIVRQQDPTARPVQTWAFSSEIMSPVDLRRFVDENIKRDLEQVTGVARASVVGGRTREIQVLLRRDQLTAYNLSPNDVYAALEGTNIDFPGGTIQEEQQDLSIEIASEFATVEQINNVYVDRERLIKVDDVAEVRDHFAPVRGLSRLNGEPAVTVAIAKQSEANTVEVAEAVKERVDELRGELPGSIQLALTQDNSEFVRGAVHDIYVAIGLGALLAVVVVFFFLGNLRSTLVVGFSIPVSLIATFILFNAQGFSLNFMSLLALAVAVGLVIDDSIIIIENIYRHIERGKDVRRAVVEGAAEISLAALAATLTLLAVFVPVGLMTGIIGQFFRQFGLGVAFAIGISLLVAFTMIPTAMYFLFRGDPEEVKEAIEGYGITNYFDRSIFEPLERVYGRAINWALNHRALTVILGGLFFFATFPIFIIMRKAFIPQFDQGQFVVNLELPPDRSLSETDRATREVEEIIADLEGVSAYVSTIGENDAFPLSGVNEARVSVNLKEKSERELGVFQMIDKVNRQIKEIPGANIFASPPSSGPGGKPVTVALLSSSLDDLRKASRTAQDILAEIPGTQNVESSLKPGKLQVSVKPLDAELERLGISPVQLGSTLNSYFQGAQVGDYTQGGEDYEIRVYTFDPDRKNASDLENAQIWAPANGQFVPLDSIAEIDYQLTPLKIERRDRQRAAVVDADVSQTVGQGAGGISTAFVSQLRQSEEIPDSVSIDTEGSSEQFQEMFTILGSALLLSIIFVYMVLASQFNSLYQPIVILISLPLATFGAVLLLYVSGMSFSLMGFIGIIMLTGLVAKNAILLVDYTNILRQRDGKERNKALREAGEVRLRPVVMTALTAILALVPTALGIGQGGGFRAPMAVAIIGGLSFSTVLTLIVIPVVYSLFDDWMGGGIVPVEETRYSDLEQSEGGEREVPEPETPDAEDELPDGREPESSDEREPGSGRDFPPSPQPQEQ